MRFTTGGTSTQSAFNGTFIFHITPARPAALPESVVRTVMEAVSTLDLDLPLSLADVRMARKRLARQHHPDVGGSLALMQQINAAADLLEHLT